MKSPAFQFYADDFFAGTADLSQAETGAYIRLLCHQWNRGSIPVEPEKLERLAGGSVSQDVLAKFPAGEDGLRRNGRLEDERRKQAEYREKQRQKGLASGASRRTTIEQRLNSGSNSVRTKHEPKTNSPSPSPYIPPISPKGEASPWSVAFGLELPEPLRTPECLEAVQTWLRYKRERREGYKAIGLRASLSKWGSEFTADEFPGAVQTSMAMSWKGIFRPDKPHTNGKPPADLNQQFLETLG